MATLHLDTSFRQLQTDTVAANRQQRSLGDFRSRLRPIVTQEQPSAVSPSSRGREVLSTAQPGKDPSRELLRVLELSPLNSSYGGLEYDHFPSFPHSLSPNYPDDTESPLSSEESEGAPKATCSDPKISSSEHTPGLSEDQQSPLFLRTPWPDDSRIAVVRPSSTAASSNRPPTPFPFAKILVHRKEE